MTAESRSKRATSRHPAAPARIGVVAVVLLLAACQAPAALSSSAPPVAVGSGGPSSAPSVPGVPAPSSSPTTPSAPPSPNPTPVPAWSKPMTVGGLSGCRDVVAAIDEQGGKHLAATCEAEGSDGSAIRYSTSADGQSWTTTALDPPADRSEFGQELAFNGDTLFLAYTRVAPGDAGCGDDGLDDVGVWYRTRTLPSGAWSEPIRMGTTADALQAFRVSGGSIHATIANEKNDETAYLVQDGSSARRYEIANATGGTSLRIGDDGKGRIAYETAKGIGYGMVEGGRFVGRAIANDTNAHAPVLTLAPGNTAYLTWTQSYHGGGCAEPDPLPSFGTYFATNASGSWVSSRLTTLLGSSSMTLDPATGEIHVLVSDWQRIVHFHRPAAGGEWASETLARDGPSSAVIRQDPTNGNLVVAYVSDTLQGDGPLEIRVMVRG